MNWRGRWARTPLFSVRGWGACFLLAAGAALGTVSSAAAAAVRTPSSAAPPPEINFAAFEAAKRHATLPDGVDLAYVQMGDPHGTPVVLIHGYTGSALDWAPLLPYLPRHWRLILPDLRGHGASSKPECCYDLDDFAYDIKLLLDRLQVTQADVVGYSLGSMVAQRFAETWPQRTRRVVLLSSTGQQQPCKPPAGLHEFDCGMPEIRALKATPRANSPFMITWWSSPTPVDEQFIERERHNAAQMPLRVWRAVLDQSLTDPDLAAMLPRLTAPTLLIWGSRDPIMSPADRASLEAALPHAEVKIFPGLGHNQFWEQPRAVATVIDRFLARPQS